MKKDTLDILHPLIHDLISRESDPGEIHMCPNCKGKLHVSIQILKHAHPPRYLAVGARCEKCKIEGYFHFDESAIPPWAKESIINNMSLEEALKYLNEDSEEE
ncbi:MAG TPA: hypothetical protein VFR47_00805 [Anaerolineales bacterium]|nr:hypothetical protein [Anaerolineales bacterium]